MKKYNSNNHLRSNQAFQEERIRKVQKLEQTERTERARQNLNINPNLPNNQHHRKHNSPDAAKLRSYQNQKKLFTSKNKVKAASQQTKQRQQNKKKQGQENIHSHNEVRKAALSKNSSILKPASQPEVQSLSQKLISQKNDQKMLHQKLSAIQLKLHSLKLQLQKKREQKRLLAQKRLAQKQSSPQPISSPLSSLVTQVAQHKQLHSFEKNPYSRKNNIYYVSEVVRAYLDEQSLAREHVLTSLHILRVLEKSQMLSEEDMAKRRVDLPIKKGKQGKKSVVFDLDQTLIHCNDSLTPPYDVKLPIIFPTGQVIEAGINIRPYAREILKNLAVNFEVIVFTASHSCYANVVLDYLDPSNQYIDHRLFREHCYQTPQGMYAKDLRVINRPLSSMILIDNAAYSYAFQLDNGIPILPYYHGSHDFQLKALQKYINSMLDVEDVREVNRRTFMLHQYKHYYGEPERMVEELYCQDDDEQQA